MPPSAFRLLASRVVKHGRQVFEGFIQRGEFAGKVTAAKVTRAQDLRRFTPVKQSWLGHRLGLRPYLGPLAAEIRHRTCQNFMGGTANIVGRGVLGSRWYNISGRLSLYAFLGVSLAGLGSDTDTELERSYDSVCANIRTIFQGKQREHQEDKTKNTCRELDDLEFGPLIAISCNSAVYSARLHSYDDESDISIIDEEDASIIDDEDCSISSYDDLDSEGEEMSEADSDITIITHDTEEDFYVKELEEKALFPLAVKMLFNYDASSNASEIFQQMASELVPMSTPEGSTDMLTWQNGNHVKKKRLPPHPNIISAHDAIVQEMPELPDALLQYPLALPPRLNPEGYGRNKTLFLIMDRYDCTLREYLRTHVLSFQESLLLLAQLTEAVVHINNHQVAHRDLKSDNIMLEEMVDGFRVVVTDFGSCLAELGFGLRVPYHIDGLSKGGNANLMAPEIATAKPGLNSYLDYSKSDLWAVASIAYEIFNNPNPFYSLDNRTYSDCDIPDMQGVPELLNRLVKSMLARDPEQRPDASLVATCLHLMLWLPSDWLSQISLGGSPPNQVALMRWLTTFSAATLCHSQELDYSVEMELRRTILSRVSYSEIKSAFKLLSSFSC